MENALLDYTVLADVLHAQRTFTAASQRWVAVLFHGERHRKRMSEYLMSTGGWRELHSASGCAVPALGRCVSVPHSVVDTVCTAFRKP